MHRVEVLRVFPGEAEQPGGFIDEHQMFVLPEDLISSWHGGAIKVSIISDIRLPGKK
jgi:hypothetical protein